MPTKFWSENLHSLVNFIAGKYMQQELLIELGEIINSLFCLVKEMYTKFWSEGLEGRHTRKN
jgi:hypothetical protein